MLINELVLNNFRVYRGENRFDLAPRKRYGKVRPIILFGGLNGAGKTSILTGLRLALYGKSSLGPSTSQKQYDDFLVKSIHKSRYSDPKAQDSSVELAFNYSKLGVNSEYRVIRNWGVKGKTVKETLEILENGEIIKGLSYEQAQNFLNELIPIGVSDLFFFDGEKIKELADDTGGEALEHSIKKLLGLDVIERLSGDLTVLNRNLTKISSYEQVKKDIDTQQAALDEHKRSIECFQSEVSTLMTQKAEKTQQLTLIQARFDDRGGHYSASRKEIEQQIDQQTQRKSELTSDLNQLLADATPLFLSGEFKERVKNTINSDLDRANPFSNKQANKRLASGLKKQLGHDLNPSDLAKVDAALKSLISTLSSEQENIIHDLTPSQAGGILSSFHNAEEQALKTDKLFEQLQACEDKLDELGASLARAPDDEVIKKDFDKLVSIQKEISVIDVKLDTTRSAAKKEANLAVDCARKLDRLYEQASKSSDQGRVMGYISATNELLQEFVLRSSHAKINELEQQFVHCFSRLARKDDFSLQIKVDPQSFKFDLVTDTGDTVDKDDLSAGEKQIFAISILEALAKTSGRQLPMIVDTPLGRLDSQHRRKLINEYFPKASHQMIILSTDTEVDEEFYESLSPDISRAYKLEYSSKTGATMVSEGYFWQQRQTG